MQEKEVDIDIRSCLSSDKNCCVDDPAIEKVLDRRTREIKSAQEIIANDYKQALELRRAISHAINDNPYYACAICERPVTIASNIYKTGFYFRHLRDNADCPIKTGDNKTDEWRRAEKYKGAKESPEHIELKELIRCSISADNRFSEPIVEKVWMGGDPRNWRKPDVRATYTNPTNGKSVTIAFEAQLSTTFLKEMTERRQFYLDEGGFLFWIFKDFDFELAQMSKRDVFINNKCNAFIIDTETTNMSVRSRKLYFRCLWAEPCFVDGKIIHVDRSECVSIEQLTLDTQNQAVHYYDYDYHKRLVNECLDKYVENERVELSIKLFKSKWKDGQISPNEALDLARELIPVFTANKYTIIPYVNMLLSAESGKPFGWNYDNNVSVFHAIYNKEDKGLVLMLCCALKTYDHIPSDKTGKIKRKIDYIRNDLVKNTSKSKYAPDRRLDPLGKLLFPIVYDAYLKACEYFKIN
ncbi:MAG: DUF6035 family protein [Solidesulfovibrio sp.]